MEISQAQIGCMFLDFNEKYFSGELPLPEIKIIKSFRYFGFFKANVYDDGIEDPVIEISGEYDYKPSQIRDILVHEMIHYYLAYTGIEIGKGHGKEFKKMMRSFNKNYKMHITETIDMSKYKRRKGSSWIKYKLASIF